jgi:hypothetical protein
LDIVKIKPMMGMLSRSAAAKPNTVYKQYINENR